MVPLVAQTIKRLPAVRETRVRSLGWEYPLEKEMATHSSTLAWKVPRMEEPGGLQSVGKSPTPGISPLVLLGIARILHEKHLGMAFAITHVDTLVQRLFLTEKEKHMVIGLHACFRN